MEDSVRKVSKLALASLAVSVLWYVGAAVAVVMFYSVSQPAPQRWDALLYAVILGWGWLITALLSVGTGMVSLHRIGQSQGRVRGRFIAIAGMVLAVLPAGLLIWFLY